MAGKSATVWVPRPDYPTDMATRRRAAQTINDSMQFAPMEAGSYPGIGQTGLDQNAALTGAAPSPDMGAMAPDPGYALRAQAQAMPWAQAQRSGDDALRQQLALITQAYGNVAANPNGATLLQQLRDAMQTQPAGTTPQSSALARMRDDVRGGMR